MADNRDAQQGGEAPDDGATIVPVGGGRPSPIGDAGDHDAPPSPSGSAPDEGATLVPRGSGESDADSGIGGGFTGSLADRFEILGSLGEGGMGVVLKARDKRLGREVALKRLKGDSDETHRLIDRFEREARTVAGLEHPNIVRIYTVFDDADGLAIEMELIDGGSLQQRIDMEGALPVDEVVRIGVQLCEALEVAHARGIVHRDIKPGNVLLTRRGTPKLADFGLAVERTKEGDGRQTVTGSLLGTPHYAAPEQLIDGKGVDARADLYSLGATLYAALTGASPRTINLDRIPKNLRPVIGKCLEERAEDRFQSAEQFGEALRSSMDDSAQPAKPPRRVGVLVAATVVSGLAIGGALWMMLSRSPSEPTSAGSGLEVAEAPDAPRVARDGELATSGADVADERRVETSETEPAETSVAADAVLGSAAESNESDVETVVMEAALAPRIIEMDLSEITIARLSALFVERDRAADRVEEGRSRLDSLAASVRSAPALQAKLSGKSIANNIFIGGAPQPTQWSTEMAFGPEGVSDLDLKYSRVVTIDGMLNLVFLAPEQCCEHAYLQVPIDGNPLDTAETLFKFDLSSLPFIRVLYAMRFDEPFEPGVAFRIGADDRPVLVGYRGSDGVQQFLFEQRGSVIVAEATTADGLICVAASVKPDDGSGSEAVPSLVRVETEWLQKLPSPIRFDPGTMTPTPDLTTLGQVEYLAQEAARGQRRVEEQAEIDEAFQDELSEAESIRREDVRGPMLQRQVDESLEMIEWYVDNGMDLAELLQQYEQGLRSAIELEVPRDIRKATLFTIGEIRRRMKQSGSRP